GLLQIRRDFPRIYNIHLLYYACYAVGLVACVVAPYHISIKLSALVVGIASLTGFCVGCYIAWKGQRTARLYVLSWGALLLATAILAGNKAGLVASGFWTDYALQIGSALEVMLLSFALANRIDQERQAKELAQQEALNNARQVQ